MKNVITVKPKIAGWIVEMQSEYNLPVDIIVGKNVNGLKSITFIYNKENENAMKWMVDKCTRRFYYLYGL